MNPKIIYVTGCLGFIGSHITRRLLKQGNFVRGIDKITYAANIDLLDEFYSYDNFVFEKIDICDIKQLYDCDYIINCAAETHVDNSIVSSDSFVHSNINGVHNLLKLIKTGYHYKMPILIHFSTDEVYGDSTKQHIETDLLNPSNPYSATKASADMLILAWARTYKIPYVIVRPSNNYGTYQYIEKLIPKCCKYLSLNRKIPLHDEGKPVRHWLHVEDTTDAIIKIIESNVVNEIFNIAGHYGQPNIETVQQIVDEYFGERRNVMDYVEFTHRVGQDMRYNIDDSKIISYTKWYPNHQNFRNDIREIVKYYKGKFIW